MKSITQMIAEAEAVLNGPRSILGQVFVNLLTIFAGTAAVAALIALSVLAIRAAAG